MAAEKTTTIRMDANTLKRLDGIARAMSRSRAWVLNQAIERYLDYEEWFVSAVSDGLKEADQGDVLEHAAVTRKWERKRAVKVGPRG
jgi:predicted transcriptional regulator